MIGIKQRFVLAPHGVAADQRFLVRYEVANTHAFFEGQACRLCHVATQGDGIGQLWRDGLHGQQVAIFERCLQALGVQGKVLHAAGLAVAWGQAF